MFVCTQFAAIGHSLAWFRVDTGKYATSILEKRITNVLCSVCVCDVCVCVCVCVLGWGTYVYWRVRPKSYMEQPCTLYTPRSTP